MNIKKYFDLDFLNKVSNDSGALQRLCNEDNGFIFKRLQDSNIFPDKEVVNKVNSHAAITFLFENYQITDEDYKKYSLFFADNSPIIKKSQENNSISKEAAINILFDESKGFILPGFFLTKDDFINYEDLLNNSPLSTVKKRYLLDSFLSLDQEDIKEIPLSVFAKHNDFYVSSSHYLFDDHRHLENYRNNFYVNSTVLLEYFCKCSDFSILKKVPSHMQTQLNIEAIYFIIKNKDNSFTINDIFQHLSVTAKIEIIKNDYTGDFDPQILIDRYLNNKNKLQLDFGRNFNDNMKNVNLPPILKHYISLISIFEKISKLETINSDEELKEMIALLEDKKTLAIDLSKMKNASTAFENLLNNNMSPLLNFLNINLSPFLNKAISLYYTQVFDKNDSIVSLVPKNIFSIVYENTKNSLNKVIFLNSSLINKNLYDYDYYNDSEIINTELNIEMRDMLIDSINLLPLNFHKDLTLLIDNKKIPLDSPLFEADCALNVTVINNVKYITKPHLNILPEKSIGYYLNNGFSVRDEVWDSDSLFFYPQCEFKDWQLEYIRANYKNNDKEPFLSLLVENIKKDHKYADNILGKNIKHSKILSSILKTCGDKLDFIYNRNYYENDQLTFLQKKDINRIELEVKNINRIFIGLSEKKQNKVVESLMPNNFHEANFFSELTNKKEILINYITSVIKQKKYYEYDEILSLISEEHFEDLINPVFWNNLDIHTKENIFIYAEKKLIGDSFFNILQLIDFNNPKDDMEHKLKAHTINNHTDKLLYSHIELKKIWNYDMEDLYLMFQRLNDQNNWIFRQDINTRFSNYVTTAISNSTKSMFWEVLDKAKIESPAVYSMLANPLAIYNKMQFGDKFLSNEFKIFKENYVNKNLNKMDFPELKEKVKTLSSYTYIYDIIDLDVVAQGIDSIRQSLSIGVLNQKSRKLEQIITNNINQVLFSSLFHITDYNSNKLHIKNEKFTSFINNLIELDVANVNIINTFSNLLPVYGEDKFALLVSENIKSIKDINSVFFQEISSTNYEKEGQNLIERCRIDNASDSGEFYNQIFEFIAKANPENALFLSYLCNQREILNCNFKENVNFSNEEFEKLKNVYSSKFGSNIHAFAKDFFNSSQLHNEIYNIMEAEDNNLPKIENGNFKL